MQINKQAHFWDKKAKTYPTYDNNEHSSAKQLLNKLKVRGVEFAGKKVLDIGCGTGRVSIEIAKKAADAYGIDVSKEMLSLFESSAAQEGVCNTTTVCGNFGSVVPQMQYDIVIATMTPALQTKEDFKKAISFAKELFIYVGWGRYRSAPLLERAFELHGSKLHLPFGAPGATAILQSLGYNVAPEYSEEVWEHEMDIDDAVNEMCWHIEIGGVTPDKEIVERLLKSEYTNTVKHSHTVETGLIICKI